MAGTGFVRATGSPQAEGRAGDEGQGATEGVRVHGEQGYRDVQHVSAFLRVLLREREPGGGGAERRTAFGHEREFGGLRGGFEIIYIKIPNPLAGLNTRRFNAANG